MQGSTWRGCLLTGDLTGVRSKRIATPTRVLAGRTQPGRWTPEPASARGYVPRFCRFAPRAPRGPPPWLLAEKYVNRSRVKWHANEWGIYDVSCINKRLRWNARLITWATKQPASVVFHEPRLHATSAQGVSEAHTESMYRRIASSQRRAR